MGGWDYFKKIVNQRNSANSQSGFYQPEICLVYPTRPHFRTHVHRFQRSYLKMVSKLLTRTIYKYTICGVTWMAGWCKPSPTGRFMVQPPTSTPWLRGSLQIPQFWWISLENVGGIVGSPQINGDSTIHQNAGDVYPQQITHESPGMEINHDKSPIIMATRLHLMSPSSVLPLIGAKSIWLNRLSPALPVRMGHHGKTTVPSGHRSHHFVSHDRLQHILGKPARGKPW